MKQRRIRRLARKGAYVGANRYFVTIAVFRRQPRFLDRQLVDTCVAILQQVTEAHRFVEIAHSFMRDHVHLLLEGTTARCDLRRLIKDFKQRTGYHSRSIGHPRLWQIGYHDRIVRQDEDLGGYVAYIAGNAARAGLAAAFSEPPFTRRPDLQVGRLAGTPAASGTSFTTPDVNSHATPDLKVGPTPKHPQRPTFNHTQRPT